MPRTLTHLNVHCSCAGITGVKVDCQAGVGLIGSKRGGGPIIARSFHDALEDSIRTHFPGNHAINCMAHSTENIYRCVFWPRHGWQII